MFGELLTKSYLWLFIIRCCLNAHSQEVGCIIGKVMQNFILSVLFLNTDNKPYSKIIKLQ